jgi:hypothetical protein
MLRAFLKKRADNREYEQTFDNCLLLLFHAFPDALPSLKRGVDLTDMMRSLQADCSNARESSVHAATMLIGPLLASLSGAERQAALEAFEREDPNDPIYKGFNYMFDIVNWLRLIDPPPNRWQLLVSRLSYEIGGQLRGMPRETIHARRMEAEVQKEVPRSVAAVAEINGSGSGT